MSDFTLVALVINATMAVALIWWWSRYGRFRDRWRVPVGGLIVALVLILVALVGDHLMGR